MRHFIFAMVLILCSGATADTPKETSSKRGVSGHYTHSGSGGDAEKSVVVYFHKPTNFTPQSPVLLVLPGSGRNAWDYRDAWIEASEKYGVLIVSPSYSQKHYPMFWHYNIAGMLTDVRINKARTGFKSYTVVKDPQKRLFRDFDAIFEEAAHRFDARTDQYDMFGHSAGGQIIHRFTLIRPQNKAHRLVAANAGWYTVPRLDTPFPFGLENSGVSKSQLAEAFAAKLTVLLGERDNQSETRGHLARNPDVDVQGTHRLARGKYFFGEAQKAAHQLGAGFNWALQTVPGVGHDYRKMSRAAADLLYAADGDSR